MRQGRPVGPDELACLHVVLRGGATVSAGIFPVQYCSDMMREWWSRREMAAGYFDANKLSASEVSENQMYATHWMTSATIAVNVGSDTNSFAMAVWAVSEVVAMYWVSVEPVPKKMDLMTDDPQTESLAALSGH